MTKERFEMFARRIQAQLGEARQGMREDDIMKTDAALWDIQHIAIDLRNEVEETFTNRK